MSEHDASSSPGELPPEVAARLEEDSRLDPDVLEEVWRLSGRAAPKSEFPPEQVEALRESIRIQVEEQASHPSSSPSSATSPFVGDRGPKKEKQIERPSAERTRSRWPNVWAIGAVLASVLGAAVLCAIAVPEQLKAPPGQVRTATLPDGSRVELNSGTTLRYPRWWQVRFLRQWMGRTVHLDGEAFFTVAANEAPFRVETRNAVVRALGTQFNVWARETDDSLETRVVVAEGRVALSAMGKTLQLDSAQAATVRGREGPSSKASVRPEHVLAWRRGGFFFRGASIRTIAAEVERRFDVPVVVKADVEGRPVTLQGEKEGTPTALLKDVCSVAGCQVESSSNRLVVRP